MDKVKRFAEKEEKKIVPAYEKSVGDVLHQTFAIEVGPLIDVLCSQFGYQVS